MINRLILQEIKQKAALQFKKKYLDDSFCPCLLQVKKKVKSQVTRIKTDIQSFMIKEI